MTPEDYDAQDATGLAALVARGETTAEELLDLALALTEARNPAINAVVNLAEAKARADIAAGLPAGPFCGVPFLLKDMDAEAKGLPLHDGSELLRGTPCDHDSNLVARLRAAGLALFGRTTAPEGGVGVTTEAAVYGGPTRNPWDLTRSPGGSSGGAAAAVAAGIVPAAHGSDGGGSVRIPASACGLVGFKTTRGLLPFGPDAGEGWAGMASAGFLTRSMRDTARLLDAVAGADPGAPYHAPPLRACFAAALERPPAPLRIALCDTTFDGAPVHPECARAARDAAALLEDLGHHVAPALPKADHRAMMAAWTDIVACGTLSWVAAAARDQGITLDAALAVIEPACRGACLRAREVSGVDYLAAIGVVHRFGRDMAGIFRDHDVLLSPTLAEPPAGIGRFAHSRPEFEDFRAYRMGPGGCFDHSPFTAAFNASGQPAVSLPLHHTSEGLPVGVHLAADQGGDEMLMALCAQIEQARPWFQRRPDLAALERLQTG